MSTPNFAYTNRCIVVTDDDFEMGNVPQLESRSSYNRYRDSSVIPTDFRFFDVVLTNGYYAHASIDYEANDKDWRDIMNFAWDYCPDTKSEFMREVMDEFPQLTKYRINKLCKGIRREQFNFSWEYWDAMFEAVGEYLAEVEEIEVNKFLDELKAKYGYAEYVCDCVFSNGEAIYSKIA